MEVLNGVVSNPISCKNTTTQLQNPSITSKNLSFSHVCVAGNRNLRNFVTRAGNFNYKDEGHLQYYYSPVCGEGKGKVKKGWNGMPTKKRMKLLKGLVDDLCTFSDLGFGLSFDCDQGALSDVDDKSKIISQAAEVLLAQLKQLRAEEEEHKKREKEEKKKCKTGDCESSSSSESESSDSECDDEVFDMKQVRGTAAVQKVETKEIPLRVEEQLSAKFSSLAPEGSENETASLKTDEMCCNMILDVALSKDASIEVLSSATSILKQPSVGRTSNLAAATSEGQRIEVCMGGKCKKSGAPMLMEEFQKAIGDEGAVVGCKCMGKCKSAPNVKVLNGLTGETMGDDSLRTPSDPLYIGVGLEDVDYIVANYLGEEMKGLTVAGVAC